MLMSCYYLQKTTIPIGSERFGYSTSGKNKTLFVLLPGIGDKAQSFEQHGFIDTLFRMKPKAGIVAIESHFKYYQNKTVVERIDLDVVSPAQKDGYDNIYFVGTSLGGLGSLLYLKYHPNNVSGLVLIAPYLGEKPEYAHLLSNTAREEDKIVIDIWSWIVALPAAEKNKIFLSYGKQDKFAEPNELLSRYLSPAQTYTEQGKHQWSTWKALFPEIVNRMLAVQKERPLD